MRENVKKGNSQGLQVARYPCSNAGPSTETARGFPRTKCCSIANDCPGRQRAGEDGGEGREIRGRWYVLLGVASEGGREGGWLEAPRHVLLRAQMWWFYKENYVERSG